MHGGELTIHSVVTIFHFGSKKQLGRNLPCDGRRGLTGWARLFHPFHSVLKSKGRRQLLNQDTGEGRQCLRESEPGGAQSAPRS